MKKMMVVASLVTLCAVALGQQYKVLYSFRGGPDGFAPQSLIFDHSGNLYGTTFWGGDGCSSYGCGTVFRLSPNGDGGWSETVLYSFCSQPECPDGYFPNGGLVIDPAGNLYGTTQFGGTRGSLGGVVFELSPTSHGPWTETVLYNFCYDPCPDGSEPANAIARDSAGNLYGATTGGGTCNVQSAGCGTVFELSPPSRQGGSWTESVLYNFCSTGSTCPDGYSPVGGMALDTHGNLFGTTEYGGNYVLRFCPLGCGTIFKLSPISGGWTYSLLYASSSPSHGYLPTAPLTISSADTIYGSFTHGGRNQVGALFELLANGRSSEFSFPGNSGNPMAGLVLGRGLISGSTYGEQSYGNVFQLTSSGQETVLYTFCSQSNCTDGDAPLGLTQDSLGNLYGVAFQGGNPVCTEPPGCGVVFEITPSR